mgnify:CR=1 FL=1
MKQHAVLFTEVCPPTAEKAGVIRALLRKFDRVYIIPIYCPTTKNGLSSFHLNTMFMHATKQWMSDPMRLHRIHVLSPIIYMDQSKSSYLLDMCWNVVTELHDVKSLTVVFDIVEFKRNLPVLEKIIFFINDKNLCLYVDATELDTFSIDLDQIQATLLPIYNIAGRRNNDVRIKIEAGANHNEISRLLGNTVYRYAFDNGLLGLRTST